MTALYNLAEGTLAKWLPLASEVHGEQGDHQAGQERGDQQGQPGAAAAEEFQRPAGVPPGAGLAPALREICAAYQHRLGVTVDASLDDVSVPAPVEHALLRITQEACANAVRHGHARRLTVSLARQDGHVELAVSDTGTGFDPAAPHPGSGLTHIRVADDHRVVRDGLCYLLGQEPDVEVAGEAGDGRQAVDVVAATRPDVLLLDLYMPELDGHAVLAALHDTPHRPAVVVLTSATDDEHLVRAVHAGATSYLLKTAPAEDVIAAVRDAAARTASLSPELLTRLTQALRRPPPPDPLQPLSPREREVLQLIARGHSNRQIARDLVIGEQTVKTHVRSILTKLGLQDRVQAAIFALRHQPDSGEHWP
jgi:two-component system, NarL family, response regulator LiaR